MDLRRRTAGLELRREVDPPPSGYTSGLGVMIVAAMAMFFALASSAFVLRTRMAEPCAHSRDQRPMIAPVIAPYASADQMQCGEMLTTGDGDVLYIACEPTSPDGRATRLPAVQLATPDPL